jgi:putative addiction module killer protein
LVDATGGRPRTGEDCDPNQPLAAGNFGDCKSLRQGLYELRVDRGPGYRVYYAMIGRECVLLLCGGDKRKQAADIERALEYLKDYKERSGTS